MKMRDLSDSELHRLILHRDREALEIIYDRYAKLVYSFALRVVGREDIARDIVQQVFTRLWTSSAVYSPDRGRFVNWLLTITRNIAIDELRKERRQAYVEPVDQTWLEARSASDEAEPELVAIRTDEREKVRKAYRELSEPQQQLLDLFYWQGYSLSEIAGILEQPIGTLKSRLHQSLKMLRRLMSQREEG